MHGHEPMSGGYVVYHSLSTLRRRKWSAILIAFRKLCQSVDLLLALDRLCYGAPNPVIYNTCYILWILHRVYCHDAVELASRLPVRLGVKPCILAASLQRIILSLHSRQSVSVIVQLCPAICYGYLQLCHLSKYPVRLLLSLVHHILHITHYEQVDRCSHLTYSGTYLINLGCGISDIVLRHRLGDLALPHDLSTVLRLLKCVIIAGLGLFPCRHELCKLLLITDASVVRIHRHLLTG